MVRPQKEGLDYFPIDIDIHEDDKLTVPIGKYGMQGFGIIIRIMAQIYKNSYFYPWTEKEQYALSSKVNVDINLINEIVNECAKWGFFHENLLSNHKILTSRGFQKRYIEAANRRKSITMIDQYVLIDLAKKSEEITIFEVDVNGNEVNVYIKPIKCNVMNTVSTQSKVKESKVKNKDLKTLSRQPKTYAEDSAPYMMAIYLHGRIMKFAESISKGHLVRDAKMQKWADSCRKMLEIDKRDRAEARAVIDWATSDPFWQQNILSPDKLREKYEELTIKMSATKKSASTSSNDRHYEKNREAAKKIMEAEARERIRDQANLLENQQPV